MSPFYEQVCAECSWPIDEDLLARLRASNAIEIEELDNKVKDATENHGELEVLDALIAKAEFFYRIGDKEAAFEALNAVAKKPMSSGQKIDNLLCMLRVALFHGDTDAFKANLTDARKAVELGGDWDRRNRLKVYEAVHAMLLRDFDSAATNLLASVATFTSYELFSYSQLVSYAVMTAVISLPRVELKSKVVDSSEVLSVIRTVPELQTFLNALYSCDYKTYFKQLLVVYDLMLVDRYLAPHARHYLRQMRVLGYKQFLASYRSVTLESMARIFGVSTEFLDMELSRFIAAGRLHAKIDKPRGIVETMVADSVNLSYQGVIKQGDALLNRIQKLSQTVINA